MAAEVDIDPTPIAIGEARPGDLVFLKPLPDDPVSQQVKRLDGGHFSHVGIVLEDGLMISARTKPTPKGESLGFDSDLGGIRCNPITDMFGTGPKNDRQPCLGRVDDRIVDRQQAVSYAWSLREGDDGKSDNSDFSYLKLFLVAAGLESYHHGSFSQRHIFDAVQRAAVAWSADAERARGRLQSFFCSELVAEAFGLDFVEENFRPPGRPERPALADDEVSAADVLGGTPLFDGPNVSVARVVLTLALLDPQFLATSIGSLVKMMLEKLGIDRIIETIEPIIPVTGGFPRSLVTPRMIESSSFVTSIRPFAKPST